MVRRHFYEWVVKINGCHTEEEGNKREKVINSGAKGGGWLFNP